MRVLLVFVAVVIFIIATFVAFVVNGHPTLYPGLIALGLAFLAGAFLPWVDNIPLPPR